MILHTISSLPRSGAIDDCARVAAPGDTVLLLDDGIYCATAADKALSSFQARGIAVQALATDCAARGVTPPAPVTTIDLDEFITLTERHARQLHWA